MSKKGILFNLKDENENDNNFSSNNNYESENESGSDKIRFIDKIDNFIDDNFSLILCIGIPIFFLNLIMSLFWLLIYYS